MFTHSVNTLIEKGRSVKCVAILSKNSLELPNVHHHAQFLYFLIKISSNNLHATWVDKQSIFFLGINSPSLNSWYVGKHIHNMPINLFKVPYK